MLKEKAFRYFLFSLAIITGFTMGASPQSGPTQAQAASRIVSSVDDSVRVTLAGSKHRLARAENDIGPVSGSTRLNRMILVLGASPDQDYQARTLLDSMHTKGSPDYHRWLTPEQFGQKFGPSSQDVQQVTTWLQQHGFSVTSVAKSRRWIEFSGTSAQAEAAFQTQMRQYQVAGEKHVANAGEISIPAALSPVVKGVLSLHNFFSKPMLSRRLENAPVRQNSQGGPDLNFTNGGHGIAPGDFSTIYDLKPLYAAVPTNLNGAGKTIAVVAASNININDVQTFRSTFMPGSNLNLTQVILNGPDPTVDPGGLGAEATLDSEWSGAAAPGANIDVVVSGGSLTTDPIALGASFIVDQNLADVMSVSFGACEALIGNDPNSGDGNPFWNSVWEQAAAQGISVFVSSGDTGAAGCDPNAPSNTPASGGVGISGFASTPFNTAVGGTQFNETVNGGLVSTFWAPTPNTDHSSALGYIPEKAWNESCTPGQAGTGCSGGTQFFLDSTGGGLSSVYSVPSYQTLSIPGLSGLPSRGIPDVSLSAAAGNDPYVFCFTSSQFRGCNGGFVQVGGGTSFSSPAFAGIMAIVDQAVGQRQGLANYVLYALAAQENFANCNSSSRTTPGTPTTCVFNDTTVGNNGVPGNDVTNKPTAGALGFPTTTGYDLATGLGSVDANNLVTAWKNLVNGFPGSTTSLTASFNGTPLPNGTVNITHGQTVVVNVSVAKQGTTTKTPGGDVSLMAQGGNLPSAVGIGFASISGSGGTASTGNLNVNNLPGGANYNLSASYPGDGTFAGSASGNIAVTVGAENTTTTLRSFLFNLNTGNPTNGTSVAYGDPVNILVMDADTRGASGLLPTAGTVTFKDGATQIGQIAIDNSGISEAASCFAPLPCLTIGTHTISASYSGDGLSYNGSNSTASLTLTVTKGNPAPTISGLATVGTGVPFTLTVAINPGLGTITPTGTVQLMDGSTNLGSPLTLSGGQASMQVTLNAGGNHSITAQYSGDSTYNAAVSSAFVVNVTAPFNITGTTTSQTIAAGGTATFNVTLNGVGGFTGTVNLSCSGAPGSSTCAVSPASATLNNTTTSVPLTVTVSNTTNARLMPMPLRNLPFVFGGVLAAVLAGLQRKPRRRMLALFALFVIAGLSACGGGGSKPPTNATLTVTATSGSTTSNISLNLTITH